jgi:hypothetical protein
MYSEASSHCCCDDRLLSHDPLPHRETPPNRKQQPTSWYTAAQTVSFDLQREVRERKKGDLRTKKRTISKKPRDAALWSAVKEQ